MISVIIPALNEAANIEYVIGMAKRDPRVSEVIVIDDGSVDGTPERSSAAGARVLISNLLGKGASMEEGLEAAANDIIVYLDGDLHGLDEQLIGKLVQPIVDQQADLVKAKFSRAAGRVTTLTAKPLLQTFFPELSQFAQPLGGIIAGRRQLLEQLKFEMDYGVDLALLIDAHFAGARIAEVDIGHLEHDSQSLDALGDMAKQVVRALLHRAEKHNRLTIRQVQEVEEFERHSSGAFTSAVARANGAEKLALFDMDGTLLRDRTIVTLAERTGCLREVQRWLDRPGLSAKERTQRIASCLAGIPRETFLSVARTMPLTPGARETIIALRKRGYRVGIVSDSFRLVTEIVRRRVFADFSVANLLRFREGIATGEVTHSPIFEHEYGCLEHPVCKWNVLLHLEEKMGILAGRVLAVGDGANDLCLLRKAGIGVAFEPKVEALHYAANHVIRGDMRQVLDLLPDHLEETRERQLRPSLVGA